LPRAAVTVVSAIPIYSVSSSPLADPGKGEEGLTARERYREGRRGEREGRDAHIDRRPVIKVPVLDVQTLLPVVVGVQLDGLALGRRRVPPVVRRGRGGLPCYELRVSFEVPSQKERSEIKRRSDKTHFQGEEGEGEAH
jgi:hypothetical protein